MEWNKQTILEKLTVITHRYSTHTLTEVPRPIRMTQADCNRYLSRLSEMFDSNPDGDVNRLVTIVLSDDMMRDC